MSMKLLVKFTVKADQVDAFAKMMSAAKATIAAAPGCESVDVWQGEAQPNVVVLAEVWSSKEIHDQYAATQDGSMSTLSALLLEPPQVETYWIL